MAHLSSSSSFSHILLNRSIIRNWKNELFFSFPVYLNWWVCLCFCLCSFYVFIRVESISGFSLCGKRKRPVNIAKEKEENEKSHMSCFPIPHRAKYTKSSLLFPKYVGNRPPTRRPISPLLFLFPPPAPIFTPGKTWGMMKKKTFA